VSTVLTEPFARRPADEHIQFALPVEAERFEQPAKIRRRQLSNVAGNQDWVRAMLRVVVSERLQSSIVDVSAQHDIKHSGPNEPM
jgi:hypothetical protein